MFVGRRPFPGPKDLWFVQEQVTGPRGGRPNKGLLKGRGMWDVLLSFDHLTGDIKYQHGIKYGYEML